jgi:hypothetical protein
MSTGDDDALTERHPLPKRRNQVNRLAVECITCAAFQSVPMRIPNSLLFVHHDAPRMLLVAVHDVPDIPLYLCRELARLALLHWDVYVLSAVVNQGNRADEELRTI